MYEAARAGCVVITEPLPDLWYFNGFPGIELNTWRRLEDTVRGLLSDEDSMAQLGRHTREWWVKCASEEATGRFMAQSIRGLRENTSTT